MRGNRILAGQVSLSAITEHATGHCTWSHAVTTMLHSCPDFLAASTCNEPYVSTARSLRTQSTLFVNLCRSRCPSPSRPAECQQRCRHRAIHVPLLPSAGVRQSSPSHTQSPEPNQPLNHPVEGQLWRCHGRIQRPLDALRATLLYLTEIVMSQSVIAIGAGIAGLATECSGQMDGYRTIPVCVTDAVAEASRAPGWPAMAQSRSSAQPELGPWSGVGMRLRIKR